jgi:hypothetical protein
MDYFAIAGATNRAKSTFPLEQNRFSALKSHLSGNSQANDPGPNNDTVNPVHLPDPTCGFAYIHGEIVTFSVV